ncbi:hypothetical protein N0V93_000872 [Gnomoniopsis smithogilvyi]|uniref:Uncharacterized protein n=1 Tax=Gnomoniopsis smithogilvyi TaxID=1191159 RepID=A0A9W9D269_9PEZI|nr:hypothetical protein N0V93_000872 [Gnomoniopsis smithogilvyi]
MAPPSTPAQPRFLPPKSQKQKGAPPLQRGPNQFAATPRFNTSRVAPRQETVSYQPPPFSTPAPLTARARATQYETPGDSIDTSPISSDVPRNEHHQGSTLNESIVIESQSPLASQIEARDEIKFERPTKRRRVSVSPVVDATPEEEESQNLMALDDVPIELQDTTWSEGNQDPMSPTEPRLDSGNLPLRGLSTRHPTFLSAPRFKTTEAVEAPTDRPPLPEAFSPQRRGAKYVTGGLAAEVRDWLVQIKGASEYDRPMGESVTLFVDQVRCPPYGGIHLISGDEFKGDNKIDASQEQTGAGKGQPPRVVLAGDGRISGLGSRNVVSQGVTVSMYQPIWDITLKDLGRFAVACDWENEGQDLQPS